MYSPASPSFSRSRLTWVSTVRVVTSASMPHTSESSASRVWTRPRRDEERVEQAELERGQRDLGLVDPRAMRVAVDLEAAEPDQRRLALDAVRAAEQRADPEDQLAHAERLDDVVIGADLEADDAIDLLALRRAHHRPGCRACDPARAGAGRSRCPRDPAASDRARSRRAADRPSPPRALAARVREPDLKALGAQVVLDRRREVDLVFDHQYERMSKP